MNLLAETRPNMLDRRQLVRIGGFADRNEAQDHQRWQTCCVQSDQARCHESLNVVECDLTELMFWRGVNLHPRLMSREAHRCLAR